MVYLLRLYSAATEALNYKGTTLRIFRNYSVSESKNTKKLSLRDVNVAEKRIFMRVDFNVPMKDGAIANNQRILAALPSIQHVLSQGCKSLVLASHLGRPNGQRNEKFSLRPVAKELKRLLKRPICFIDDCVGDIALEASKSAPKGAVMLLENLRFYAEETGKDHKKEKVNDEQLYGFRCKLSKLGEIYVNDAFGAAHRAHSSMLGEGYQVRAAGFLLEKELEYFAKALSNPKKPFLAILGGAKIADKIPLIENLLNKVDQLIVAGGMCFTFLKIINNMEIGKSLYDEKGAQAVKDLMASAKEKNVDILLPVDFKCAQKIDKNHGVIKLVTAKEGIPKELIGLDIGEKTIKSFSAAIIKAQTIVWNGPPGLFEHEEFAAGTKAVLDAVVCATATGATTIVGGGDTAAACDRFGGKDKVSHVSTGGGAALELLEGKQLPGIVALSDMNSN